MILNCILFVQDGDVNTRSHLFYCIYVASHCTRELTFLRELIEELLYSESPPLELWGEAHPKYIYTSLYF